MNDSRWLERWERWQGWRLLVLGSSIVVVVAVLVTALFEWMIRGYNTQECLSIAFFTAGVVAPTSLYGINYFLAHLTQQRVQRDLLKRDSERLHTAFALANQGWFDLDIPSGRVRASEEYLRMLGYEGQIYPASFDNWKASIHPEDRHALLKVYRQCLATGGPCAFQYRRRHAQGHWIWINSVGKVIEWDEFGHPRRMVGIHAEITERKLSEQQAWHQTNFDSLTHLPNRNLFQDRLTHALKVAERRGQRLALLFLDLDHFKAINDTEGHAVGDQVLVETARRLGSCVRGIDTVARLGGDEFTTILVDIEGIDGVERIARKIVATVDQPMSIDGEIVRISISVGIALFPDHAAAADALLQRADAAMYHAKHQGRGRFEWCEPVSGGAPVVLPSPWRMAGAP